MAGEQSSVSCLRTLRNTMRMYLLSVQPEDAYCRDGKGLTSLVFFLLFQLEDKMLPRPCYDRYCHLLLGHPLNWYSFLRSSSRRHY
jgi:hypothetical protein